MTTTSIPRTTRRRKQHALPAIGRRAAIVSALLASTSCGSPQAPPNESPPIPPPSATAPTRPGSAQELPQAGEPTRPEAAHSEALRIARVTLLPRTPRAGDTLTVEVDSNDPSQNAFLTYRWFVNGEENPGWRGRILAGHFKRGDEISVAVSAPGSSTPDSVLTDSVRIGNAPPQVEKLERPRFEEGKYTTRIVASDLDGDPLTFSVIHSPAGLSIDETGKISWTPGENDLGRHEVVISVKDDSGGEILYTYAFTVDRQ